MVTLELRRPGGERIADFIDLKVSKFNFRGVIRNFRLYLKIKFIRSFRHAHNNLAWLLYIIFGKVLRGDRGNIHRRLNLLALAAKARKDEEKSRTAAFNR